MRPARDEETASLARYDGSGIGQGGITAVLMYRIRTNTDVMIAAIHGNQATAIGATPKCYGLRQVGKTTLGFDLLGDLAMP